MSAWVTLQRWREHTYIHRVRRHLEHTGSATNIDASHSSLCHLYLRLDHVVTIRHCKAGQRLQLGLQAGRGTRVSGTSAQTTAGGHALPTSSNDASTGELRLPCEAATSSSPSSSSESAVRSTTASFFAGGDGAGRDGRRPPLAYVRRTGGVRWLGLDATASLFAGMLACLP